MICLCCRQTLTTSWGICSCCEEEITKNRLISAATTPSDPPPQWDALCTVSPYYYPLDNLIQQFKFNHKKELAKPLAHLMFRAWYFFSREHQLTPPEAIIGIPMHKEKRLKRTFNQTEALAEPLSHWLTIPHKTHAVAQQFTPFDQKQLSRAKRLKNKEQCFHVVQPLPFETLLLVDDVITTGSTLNALVNTLKTYGVKRVYALCLCQTK